MSANPPPLTHDQIEQYFDRIHLKEELRKYNVDGLSPKDALAYLALLQKYHLLTVPFENLSLHYSPARRISLHPDELFRKVVGSRGRGGYCMELNALFGRLLRSLGFTVYAVGARVNEGGGYGGWSHMLNIVTIAKTRYMVDVAFGSNYVATTPLELKQYDEGVENVYPASCRLVRKPLEDGLDTDQEIWVYQHRTGPDAEYKDHICFTEVEFRQADFEVMNLWTSTSPSTIFTQMVICTKMLTADGDLSKDIAGRVDAGGTRIKRRIGDKSEELDEMKTEDDRVKALQKYFDISFTAAEADAIKGTSTAL